MSGGHGGGIDGGRSCLTCACLLARPFDRPLARPPAQVSGLLMEKELKYLKGAVDSPVRPMACIVGGAKVSSKVRMPVASATRARWSASPERYDPAVATAAAAAVCGVLLHLYLCDFVVVLSAGRLRKLCLEFIGEPSPSEWRCARTNHKLRWKK